MKYDAEQGTIEGEMASGVQGNGAHSVQCYSVLL